MTEWIFFSPTLCKPELWTYYNVLKEEVEYIISMRQQSNDIKKKPKTSIEVNNRPAISQFPISMEYH